MVDLALQIKSIQDKLQQLLKQQTLLERENQRLQKELDKTVLLNNEKDQSLRTIRQQVDALKLGAGNLTETEKMALGKRIDGYLKEIDKCLTLLNT